MKLIHVEAAVLGLIWLFSALNALRALIWWA